VEAAKFVVSDAVAVLWESVLRHDGYARARARGSFTNTRHSPLPSGLRRPRRRGRPCCLVARPAISPAAAISMLGRARPVRVIGTARGAFAIPARDQAGLTGDTVLPAAAGALRLGVAAQTVTRRQQQARAGQVVRADGPAQCALPGRPLTRPARRHLRSFPPWGRTRNPARARLTGHRDDLLQGRPPMPGQRVRRGHQAGPGAAGQRLAAGPGVIVMPLAVIAPSA